MVPNIGFIVNTNSYSMMHKIDSIYQLNTFISVIKGYYILIMFTDIILGQICSHPIQDVCSLHFSPWVLKFRPALTKPVLHLYLMKLTLPTKERFSISLLYNCNISHSIAYFERQLLYKNTSTCIEIEGMTSHTHTNITPHMISASIHSLICIFKLMLIEFLTTESVKFHVQRTCRNPWNYSIELFLDNLQLDMAMLSVILKYFNDQGRVIKL